MKLEKLLLIVLFYSVGILYAQTDFRPGFIINSHGDTLFGKVDYRGDLLMSKVCTFKDNENKITEYYPKDIIAFRFINSKYYVSRVINQKKVFLECLIKGKISIYYMRDDKGDHYYLDKEDIGLSEMPYNEGIKLVEDKQVFFKTTKHIGILNFYMKDATGFQSKINDVKKPEHKNLIKLAEDYHNTVCKEEKCIIYEKKIPLKIAISPFLGLTNSKINNFVKEFGVYVYFWNPRLNEKIFLKTGLSYNKSVEGSPYFTFYKFPLHVQYIYRAHKLQPQASGGLTNIITNKYAYYLISLNAGLNYKFSKRLGISTAFNSEYFPMTFYIADNFSDSKLSNSFLQSYSITVGLWIDL